MSGFESEILFFEEELLVAPTLYGVESSVEVREYFENLAHYHDINPFNLGLKEFVYSDGEELNLVLSGDVPTFAVIKSDSGIVRISGGDNILLLSGSDSNIQIDGGVTRIFVDAEAKSEVSLDILSGEVIVEFLHADLSRIDDLSLQGSIASLTDFPARVHVNFEQASTGSVDFSVLGVKRETLIPSDLTHEDGEVAGLERVPSSQDQEFFPQVPDEDLLFDWSDYESALELQMLELADVSVLTTISSGIELPDLQAPLGDADSLFQSSALEKFEVRAEDLTLTLDSAIDVLATSSSAGLVWEDGIDIIHEIGPI